jgi:hypothetical protein
VRVVTIAVLLAFALPAVVAMTPRGSGAGCCCAGGDGGFCPMKNASSECATTEVATCGMGQRSDPAAALFPNIGIRPAVLTETLVTPIEITAAPVDPRSSCHTTRARHTPDAPPPKHA